MHPGGKKNIIKGIGLDSTEMFYKSHHGLKIENTPLALLKLGDIDMDVPATKDKSLGMNFGVL